MRRWIFLIDCALLLSLGSMASAQPQSRPAVPENTLNSTDTIGLPDAASKEGTAEIVNLNSGNLTMFLPVVTLPQRAGAAPLTLGFTYDSDQINLQSTSSDVMGTLADDLAECDDFCANMFDNFSYQVQTAQTTLVAGPLDINIPQLTGSVEYEGDWFEFGAQGQYIMSGPKYCLTNIAFRDWRGSTHAFPSAIPVCTYDTQVNGPLSVTTDISNDQQYYYFDGSSTTDFVVYAPDGTAYHFANPGGIPGSAEPWLHETMASSVDRYGNTMTYSTSSNLLTDTMGRKISISYSRQNSGVTISYSDSSGNPQRFTLASSADAIAAGKMSTSDLTIAQATGSDVGPYLHHTPYESCTISSSGPMPNPQYSWGLSGTYEAMPDGWIPPVQDGSRKFTGMAIYSSASDRVYKLLFDSFGHLLRITYPEGGYHRYDYSLIPGIPMQFGPVTCEWARAEVAHRYECASTAGSCVQEATTTYAPSVYGTVLPIDPCTNTADTSSTGIGGFSDLQKVVIDPDGSLTVHCFQFPVSPDQFVPFRETNSYQYSSSGTLLRSTHTVFVGCDTLYSLCASSSVPVHTFPIQLTTTLHDSTPAISSAETFSYDAVPIAIDPVPYYTYGTGPHYVENPTSHTVYGFDTNPISSTNSSWAYITLPNGATLIHEPAGSSEYDYAQNKALTKTITHDGSTGFVTNYEESEADALGAFDLNWVYTPDAWGRPTAIQDPAGNVTHYYYQDAWANSTCREEDGLYSAPTADSTSYVTSVKNAANQISTYKYDYCTGKLVSSTDPNNVTVELQYDGASRITQRQVFGSSGLADQLNVTYVDGPDSTITQTRLATPDPSLSTKYSLDGLARVYDKSVESDPQGAVHVKTFFNPEGEVQAVTNPYRATNDPTYGITSYLYDSLQRKTFQCQPDNGGANGIVCNPNSAPTSGHPSFMQWSYAGNVVTEKDEVGNTWQHTSDALGRLIGVAELGSASQPFNLQTSYTYDGFGNLLTANQNGQTGDTARHQRTFSYDALSRLTSSYNPESGSISYNFASATGLCAGDPTLPCSRTDARNATTTYGYDVLNRLTSKTYTNAPAGTLSSCFAYDTTSIGRLAAEWTQVGVCPTSAPSSGYQSRRSFLTYDALGRITSEQQCVPSISGSPGDCTTSSPTPFALSYTYDLAGNLDQYTNGLGSSSSPQILFTPLYNGAGRLNTLSSSWEDASHPSPLFMADPGNGYAPSGGLQGFYLGNDISVVKSYDNRLRIAGETATHP